MPELTPEILGDKEKFLLYGPPGAGKTFLAGTLPDPQYWLILGPPNELKTVNSPAFIEKHGRKRIFFDSIEETLGPRGHFEKATAFDKACDAIDAALAKQKSGEWPFVSIVVDNATVLQQYEMNKAMVVNYDRASSKENTALQRLREENIIIPGDNDYMSAMSLMDQFVDWYMTLPFHGVFIAHEYVEATFNRKTRETTVNRILPLFVGKQRTRIPRAFDNLWYMSVSSGGKNVISSAQTNGTEPVWAKTRVGGVLPQYLSDPNLSTVIEKFKIAD